MSLNIKNPEVLHLVNDLAVATGKNKTQVLLEALRERREKIKNRKTSRDFEKFMKSIRAIVDRVAKLPVLDNRPSDEILGYNKQGHFDGD